MTNTRRTDPGDGRDESRGPEPFGSGPLMCCGCCYFVSLTFAVGALVRVTDV
jgi:hypothetical protein